MKLSDKQYDFLKWFALIFVPALTTFLGVVLTSLNFEHADIVLTIIGAFGTFLGTVIGVSTSKYNQGEE